MNPVEPAGPGAGLRAARREKGWSQAQAARELAALGAGRGVPTASPPSLKSQLSRWENGHAAPEEPYRRLLAELYGHDGLDPGRESAGPTSAGVLRDRLDEAAAVDEPALGSLTAQLAATREVDARLGASGTADALRGQLGQLARILGHTCTVARRQAIAGLLAEAALLAGWQALDQADVDDAWHRHTQARTAAHEARAPALLGEALAGQAAVLIELGRSRAAVELLTDRGVADATDREGAAGSAWVAAALGAARAANGDLHAARCAFDAAERLCAGGYGAAREPRPDVAHPGLDLDYDGVHRWRGAALAPLGDPEELARLRALVAAPDRPVRQRAALEAELAVALEAQGRPGGAHARSARLTAGRIGSHRVRARLDAADVGALRP